MPHHYVTAYSAAPMPPRRMAEHPAVTDLLSQAPGWIGHAEAFLRDHWREAALIAAMGLASILLFWRLGTRSRQAEPELLLDDEMIAAEVEVALREPAVAEPVAVLPSRPVAPPPADVLLLRDLAPPPERNFERLHEAVAAMKADQVHAALVRKALRA